MIRSMLDDTSMLLKLKYWVVLVSVVAPEPKFENAQISFFGSAAIVMSRLGPQRKFRAFFNSVFGPAVGNTSRQLL